MEPSQVRNEITLPRELLEEGDRAAAELGVSRSRLWATALEKLLHRRENLKMLDEISEACFEPMTKAERHALEAFQRSARRIMERSER